MAIEESEIDAVARAMAEEMRVGTDAVPDRDVRLHHDEARRLIAGSRALANLKTAPPAAPAEPAAPTPAAPAAPAAE